MELADRVDRMRKDQQSKRQSDRVARELEVERVSREREKKRLEMRKAMPEIASVVDMFNENGLGPVRVLYAEEGGKVVKARGFRG